MAVTLSQTCFQFGNDDGTQATHTFRAAENVNASLPVDTNLLLRLGIQESGGSAAANLVQQFQYQRNGGTWTDVTTSSSVIRAVAVNAFGNGDASTTRLTTLTGSPDTTNANCTEDGSSGGNANDVPASGHSETVLGFQVRSADVVGGDVIAFRVTVSGPTTSITYTRTPSAQVEAKISAVYDSVSVTDAPDLVFPLVTIGTIFEATLTVTDEPTLLLPVLLLDLAIDTVTLTDEAPVTIADPVAAALEAGASDDVALTEDVNLWIPVLPTEPLDDIGLTEAVGLTVWSFIDVADAVTLTDATVVEVIDRILSADVEDDVAVSEDAVSLLPVLILTVDEALTCTEETGWAVADYVVVSANEAITVDDTPEPAVIATPGDSGLGSGLLLRRRRRN